MKRPTYQWANVSIPATAAYRFPVGPVTVFDDEPTQPELSVQVVTTDIELVDCATCIGRKRKAWKACAKCAVSICVMCAWSVPVKPRVIVDGKAPESVEMCRSCGEKQ